MFPLGWIWTGCRFITRGCPHVLSCTVRRTGPFSQPFSRYFHFSVLFSTGANSPQQAAPLFCRSHPAALLPFFEEPQQETIHSAACCSAWERQHNTQDFLFICLHNQPQLSTAEMHILAPGYLIQPLSGLTRSNTHTRSYIVCTVITKAFTL